MDAGSSALARLHLLAQAEATRLYGDAPVAHWRARASAFDAARTLRVLTWCAGLVLLAAAGWTALAWILADLDQAMPEEPGAQQHESRPVIEPFRAAIAERAVHGATLVARSLTISRAGSDWRIDAQGASRAGAVMELARISATQLFGAESLPRQARPLDLHWQGKDLATAWRAVIGDEFSYALQCQGGRCRAWILGSQTDIDSDRPRAMTRTVSTVGVLPVAVEVPDPRDRSSHD